MVRLIPGDKIDCRLKNGCLVRADKEYDEIKTFEIIAVTEYGYYVFVPQYIYLSGTTTIDEYRCKKMTIDRRFLGEEMVHVHENMVCRIVSQLDGMTCSSCKSFCMYAAANQDNGMFICFGCRQNPYA
jgi:hypothetical protein